MESIILIGMPQCGKSTVGKIISDRMGFPFKDIDRLVETSYYERKGKLLSCHEIYKIEGESYFRSIEQEAFDKVVGENHIVIATGGGTPIYHPKFNIQTAESQVFFLYCALDILWNRITSLNELPAFISLGNPFMTLQELYNARLIQYLAYSHFKIDTSKKTVDEIAEAILNRALCNISTKI